MIRVLFISRSLEAGGAEAKLLELVRHIDKSKFEVTVVTFYSGGKHFKTVQELPSVRLVSMNKRGRWDLLGFSTRLSRVFREVRPQIVCAFNGANEVSFLFGKRFHAKIVLSISTTYTSEVKRDWLFYLLRRLSRYFSYRSSLVIAISQQSKSSYVQAGYCERNIAVMHSGFDVRTYYPNRSLGKELRQHWGVSPEMILIGHIGRLDPRKDHPIFLRAAARLSKECDDLRFVCVGGRGGETYRVELEALANALGLQNRLIWAGEQSNMPAVYNALDISTITSFVEGGPRVLGEAMCCEVPTVTTDVGDAAYLLGDARWVVPVGDVEGIAERWRTLLEMSVEERQAVGKAARERILAEFSTEQYTAKMEAALESLVREEKSLV